MAVSRAGEHRRAQADPDALGGTRRPGSSRQRGPAARFSSTASPCAGATRVAATTLARPFRRASVQIRLGREPHQPSRGSLHHLRRPARAGDSQPCPSYPLQTPWLISFRDEGRTTNDASPPILLRRNISGPIVSRTDARALLPCLCIEAVRLDRAPRKDARYQHHSGLAEQVSWER